MANKFTITVNFTVTAEKEASAVMADVYSTLATLGTNCLIQQTNCNQWVDQVNSVPQVFSTDGKPIAESDVAQTNDN